MNDIAVRVTDAELATQVLGLIADRRRTASPDITPDTTLLVTDVLPDRVELPTILVTADGGPDPGLWRSAAGAGVEQVVALPSAAALFARRLDRRDADRPGTVLRVIGARGGCGATTLAVALAVAAVGDGPVVLVDGDPVGGGVDVALGLDTAAGLRWPDLVGLRHRVPAASLLPRLPQVQGIHVVSHRGTVSGMAEAWAALVDTLTTACGLVVTDVPRYLVGDLPATSSRTADVLVTPPDLPAMATARRLVESGVVNPAPVLAVPRAGGPLTAAAVAAALPCDRVIEIPQCRAVTGSMDFGDVTEAVAARPLRRACGLILDAIAGSP